MGGILEQREDTVRWVGCQPNQSAIVSCRDSENSALGRLRLNVVRNRFMVSVVASGRTSATSVPVAGATAAKM
jgi:hypothetical protein